GMVYFLPGLGLIVTDPVGVMVPANTRPLSALNQSITSLHGFLSKEKVTVCSGLAGTEPGGCGVSAFFSCAGPAPATAPAATTAGSHRLRELRRKPMTVPRRECRRTTSGCSDRPCPVPLRARPAVRGGHLRSLTGAGIAEYYQNCNAGWAV